MNKFGFEDPEPINLPIKPKSKPKADSPAITKAVKAGEKLGFVSRDTKPKKRKPGPKRTEAQDKITITGSKRVIDEFRDYCDENGFSSYWAGLEKLLDSSKS